MFSLSRFQNQDCNMTDSLSKKPEMDDVICKETWTNGIMIIPCYAGKRSTSHVALIVVIPVAVALVAATLMVCGCFVWRKGKEKRVGNHLILLQYHQSLSLKIFKISIKVLAVKNSDVYEKCYICQYSVKIDDIALANYIELVFTAQKAFYLLQTSYKVLEEDWSLDILLHYMRSNKLLSILDLLKSFWY